MTSILSKLKQLLYPIMIAYLAWNYYKKNQKTICHPDDRECADTYFSATYNEARDKFLEFSQKIKTANTYNIPLDESNTLYTDITILNEQSASNHIILHLSGVHGVEGYTGSGIQSYLLDKVHRGSITFDKNDNDPPIIIFIHAVNPFGFSATRRVNENNVDLNRNLKTEQQWNALHKSGPNAFHYDDLSALFNPTFYLTEVSALLNEYIPSKFHQYFINLYTKLCYISIPVRAVYYMSTFELKSIKIAANVGQIHNPSGYQYIGQDKVEKSHQIIKDFLKEKFAEHSVWKTQIDEITMIDVHSGDNTYGLDKLLTDKAEYATKLKQLLLDYDEKDLIQSVNSTENANDAQFLDGIYDHVNGYTLAYVDYIASLTDNTNMDLLPFSEEFGCNYRLETVGFTQILENALFQEYHGSVNKGNVDSDTKEIMQRILKKVSLWLKDVFYVQEPEWKKTVVRRGRRVFDVCLNR